MNRTKDTGRCFFRTSVLRAGALLVLACGLLAGPAWAQHFEPMEFYHYDALGSVRLVVSFPHDSGTYTISRHDYLPFGEEIQAGTFGRATALGYGAADTTPQRFTGKERDPENNLDYFGARYYSGAQGRFASVDPFNPVVDIKAAAEFERYVREPRNWNRYAYVWNAPLTYIDPNGERVYVVMYTQGNTEGDEEFKRVAETHAQRIMNRKGFDPKKDAVLLSGVTTRKDVADVIGKANNLEADFGKVKQVTLYSHSGQDGPVFQYGTSSIAQWDWRDPAAAIGPAALPVNWDRDGRANFYGCNTAVNFAQDFADLQGVPTWGFDTFSSISSSPDRKTKGYVLNPWYAGPLYMVGQDGRAPVRRAPRR
jgi:RHS repeat-associated protein